MTRKPSIIEFAILTLNSIYLLLAGYIFISNIGIALIEFINEEFDWTRTIRVIKNYWLFGLLVIVYICTIIAIMKRKKSLYALSGIASAILTCIFIAFGEVIVSNWSEIILVAGPLIINSAYCIVKSLGIKMGQNTVT